MLVEEALGAENEKVGRMKGRSSVVGGFESKMLAPIGAGGGLKALVPVDVVFWPNVLIPLGADACPKGPGEVGRGFWPAKAVPVDAGVPKTPVPEGAVD